MEQSGLGALSGFLSAANPPEWFKPVTADEILSRPPIVRDWFLDGCFKARDKVEIVGPSKIGKTWFLLGLSIHLAAGRPFLGIDVPRRRRVLYVNLEVPEDDLQTRLQGDSATCGILAAYGIDAADIAGGLSFVCCRGYGTELRGMLDEDDSFPVNGAEVVVIDPKYTLMLPGEDENSAVGLAPLLASFSRLANRGPAVVYVTHDGKGFAGDRQVEDRGAGSGITGRDYDCRICLTRHAQCTDETRLVVASFSCRAAKSPADRTLRFDCPALVVCPDIVPEFETKETKANKTKDAARASAKAQASDHAREVVRRILATEPAGLSQNQVETRAEVAGLETAWRVRTALSAMVADGELRVGAGQRNAKVYTLPRDGECDLEADLETVSQSPSKSLKLTPGDHLERARTLKGNYAHSQSGVADSVSTAQSLKVEEAGEVAHG